jgi:hypothetical protein
MAELRLISSRQYPLQPLVQEALRNEARLLRASIQRAERKVQVFESRYNLSTAEFLRRYENDELSETLELAEWIGEVRLLERLREKTVTLQEIRFAN